MKGADFLLEKKEKKTRRESERGKERVEREAPRATHGYWRQRISLKIQAKRSRDRGFRVSGTFENFIFARRGRDSSYFGLFSIIGSVWLSFNALSGCLAFFALRGCLAK